MKKTENSSSSDCQELINLLFSIPKRADSCRLRPLLICHTCLLELGPDLLVGNEPREAGDFE